jgi:hypothetical protein
MFATVLPPELKLSIADFLDPISSLNYALTCKEHWKLCHTLLETHTRRFAEAPVLASYDTRGVPTPCADGSSRTSCGIWQTLENVLRDPKEGWYITEIDLISCWADVRKAPEEVPAEFLDAAMKLTDLYSPLELADSITNEPVNSYRSEDCPEEVIVTRIFNDIKAGSPGGALAILIHHLPNVRTLRMTMDREDAVFGAVIDQVAIEYSNAVKVPRLPFRRLKTVSLSHYDSEGCISADGSLPFLRIPSLRTFAACMMGGDFRREMRLSKFRLSQPESNVEEFLFSGCQFEASALDYIIAQTRSLKRFTYTAGGSITDEALYDPKVILRALVKYARNSLEHLTLIHGHFAEEEVRNPLLSTSLYTANPSQRLFRDAPGMYDGDDNDSSDESSDLGDGSNPKRPLEANLSSLTKLQTLYADWAMLWPEVYLDTPAQGTYDFSPNLELSREPFDVRTILPPSLEYLGLNGTFQECQWKGLVEPLATPNKQTPMLTIDRMRVSGTVQSEQRPRTPGVMGFGGWVAGEQRTFGDAEDTCFYGLDHPFHLFNGHGW